MLIKNLKTAEQVLQKMLIKYLKNVEISIKKVERVFENVD